MNKTISALVLGLLFHASAFAAPPVAESPYFHVASDTTKELPISPLETLPMLDSDTGSDAGSDIDEATVVLDKAPLPIQRGMRGTCRFTRNSRTVGVWLTDEFHRVFVVR